MVRTNAPSKWQTGETLNQLRSLSIDNLDDRLDWLYKVWPRLAVRVVEDSRRLPPLHREAVRRWGENNLRPGHDGTEPPGGSAGGNGAAGSGSLVEAMYQHPNPSTLVEWGAGDLIPVGHWPVIYDRSGLQQSSTWVPNALEEPRNLYLKGQDNGKGKGKGPGDEGKGKGPADKGKGKGQVDKGKGKGKVLGEKGKGKKGKGKNKALS